MALLQQHTKVCALSCMLERDIESIVDGPSKTMPWTKAIQAGFHASRALHGTA